MKKIMAALDLFTDIIMAYRPKGKRRKKRKEVKKRADRAKRR